MAKSVKAKKDSSDGDLARQKRKVEELLAQDRQKLLLKMPFVGALLMRLDLVPVRDERLSTAATDGDRIYVDIEFYMKLKSEERLFVLAHEAWHCALIHFMRRQNRDKERFNIAADLEIHFILTDEGLKPPFVLPHNPNWKGLSAEEIYERIPKMAGETAPGGQVENGKESANIKGLGSGQGFDKHLEKGEGGGESFAGAGSAVGSGFGKGCDADYSPEVKPGAEERCRERLTAAVQQYERTKGTLPVGIVGLVNAVLRPEINWKELLAQFVTNCYGGSRRWLPPARRHVWKGLYLQSQRTERLRAVVAVDTSGSTSGDLPRFFSELTALLNSFGSYELTVIQCDAEVGKVEHFDDCAPLDPNREWEVTGFGGTDFCPVFRYIDEHSELDPSLLIFFTDGDGAYPERPPAYPVMWLLTHDGKCGVDWGLQVRFKHVE
jgi:predicted metal-dependent peptidase